MENSRLYSPKYVKEIVERYGFKFSKSLGQNFLIDGNVVRSIARSGNIGKDDYVLEIGPGIGTLTEELSLNAKKVLAVEIDKTLLPILDETLGRYENIEILYGDILDLDINKLIEDKLNGGPIKVVANLPYYVTTPIIGKLIESGGNIESISVMIQKEVADRMVAKPGSKTYGALSVFVDFYSEPKISLKVPKTVFIPQPKIDSSVITLKVKKDLPDIDVEKFFKLVKAGFSKRRKTILNALSTYDGYSVDKEDVRIALEKAGIKESERAENLSKEDFMRICENLNI